MRVKVGDTWYDSRKTPICIQTTKEENEQIYNNKGKEGKYAQFPKGWGTPDGMSEWME